MVIYVNVVTFLVTLPMDEFTSILIPLCKDILTKFGILHIITSIL